MCPMIIFKFFFQMINISDMCQFGVGLHLLKENNIAMDRTQ